MQTRTSRGFIKIYFIINSNGHRRWYPIEIRSMKFMSIQFLCTVQVPIQSKYKGERHRGAGETGRAFSSFQSGRWLDILNLPKPNRYLEIHLGVTSFSRQCRSLHWRLQTPRNPEAQQRCLRNRRRVELSLASSATDVWVTAAAMSLFLEL